MHSHSNTALLCYTSPSLREVFVQEQTSTHDLRRYYHTTAEFSNLDLLGLEQILLNMNVLSQSSVCWLLDLVTGPVYGDAGMVSLVLAGVVFG